MSLCVAPEPDSDWENRLGRLGAPLFHSAAWARYRRAGQPNLEPRYLHYRDAAGEGAALLFEECSMRRWLRPLTRTLHSDSHPVVSDHDPERLHAFLKAIEENAYRLGVVQLTIGSFGTPGHRAVLERLGYQLRDRYEFLLDLTQSEEDIRASIQAVRQKRVSKGAPLDRSVRKAEKLGVEIEDLPARQGAAELRRLLALTSRRIEQRGVAVQFRVEPARANDPIHALVESGHGRLVGARYRGSIVSVLFLTEMNGMVYYNMAGHSQEAYESQAPTLLIWRSILRFRAAGLRWFNFGGVPFSASLPGDPEHGLYAYKEQFGGTAALCTTGSKVLRPVRHGVMARLQKALG